MGFVRNNLNQTMLNQKRKKQFNKSEFIFLAVILAYPILNFLVFWFYVNFNSILLAFQYTSGNQTIWGFKNFAMLFQELSGNNSAFWMSMKNTMVFFGTGLFLNLPVALVFCFFFFKKIYGFRYFRFVFYLPNIISASVYVVIVKYIIATNGLLGEIVESFGGEPKSLLTSVDTAFITVWLYSVITSFGGNIILLGGAMNHIDASIFDAAKLDGCSMRREFFNIIIPLVWPTLSTLIIFSFVGIFGASGPILLFLGEKAEGLNANTLSFWIFSQVYYSGQYNYPSAIGLVLTFIGMPIALGVRAFLNKLLEVVEM